MRDSELRDRRYERLQTAVRAYRAALLLAVILILILALVLLSGRGRFARAIKINDQIAALVPSKTAADQVRNQLLKEGKGTLTGQTSFEEQWEDITWPVEGMEVCSVGRALELLRPMVTVLVGAVAIEVDGQEAAVLATEELAKNALEMVKGKYFAEDDKLLEPQKFREDVRIAQVSRPAEQILTDLSAAVERLTEGATTAKTYVVKKGEFPAQIAQRHGMSLAQLYALNPGVRGRYLIIGERIKVSAPAALTVVTVKEETQMKELLPEKQEIYTPTLPKGQMEVVREGKPGQKKVLVKVVYENDQVIRTEPIKGVVIEEPEPRKVMIGTGEPELSRTESGD